MLLVLNCLVDDKNADEFDRALIRLIAFTKLLERAKQTVLQIYINFPIF